MFIHFGAYSAAARHEWVKNYENLTDEEYDMEPLGTLQNH